MQHKMKKAPGRFQSRDPWSLHNSLQHLRQARAKSLIYHRDSCYCRCVSLAQMGAESAVIAHMILLKHHRHPLSCTTSRPNTTPCGMQCNLHQSNVECHSNQRFRRLLVLRLSPMAFKMLLIRLLRTQDFRCL